MCMIVHIMIKKRKKILKIYALFDICNHKATRLFFKRTIACLDSFSISVSRLMTYALFRESGPFVRRTELLVLLNVKRMKDCTLSDWEGGVRNGRNHHPQSPGSPGARGTLFCLRGFCLARVVTAIRYQPLVTWKPRPVR